ncbi:Isoquinoline 1-oxidoreductase subunit [Polyangium sp. 15x6]|uniref:Isoquinoline 1-oxidoreductase subunit n=1 Tax=Polyangium sp. 15x6 TaxID=3042687 RepID=UPI00249CE008|nr:Isoquinoline 1-oxidoreductase subunit [Polyangium sp. 15x6]MDI3284503.1 Isoquinoline 1-oxidoreductase subunit [Polyangium sp. 15x6]
MHQRLLPFAVAFVLAGCGNPTADGPKGPTALRKVAPNELRAPSDFASIEDTRERSRALFLEASRVFTHPRCVNCHPNGDIPHQGMNMQLHDPPSVRGPDNHGVVGMECTSCHQDKNQELSRVPGAPHWALAPIEMAWVGKSPRQICEQIKDPKRNGGKALAAIVEHNAHDALVGWGWHPGADREPVPGTQEQFGAIVAAWAESGAECPAEGARP